MLNNNTRAIACKILLTVISQKIPFEIQYINHRYPNLKAQETAFTANLCFGVLRFYPRLMGFVNHLLKKPLKAKDQDLSLLLMIGLYQLFYTQIPSYASLHATVAATKNLKKPWARGFVNGVLRQALRQGEELKPFDLAMKTAHPNWLVQAIQKAWPNHWEKIIEANLAHPPFILRVNLHKISREDYIKKLLDYNISATMLDFVPTGIVLENPLPVTDLPLFSQGFVSVQDGAAQLAAPLLDIAPNMRVLDACAAPGGKAAHLLEMQNDITLIAIEKDKHRSRLIHNTLERINLNATVHTQDATRIDLWWDGEYFDRILLDAPCSATGIIRRHPDIKVHREPTEILLLAQQQRNLLDKLWPLLKPNGILLYATCSILPQENEEVIEQFLQANPEALVLPIKANGGLAQKYGYQIHPQTYMDGFYYAKLKKRSLL